MNRRERREAERRASKMQERAFKAASRMATIDLSDETTPVAITDDIVAFCRALDPTTQPVFVDVRPLPEAIEADCFFNVADEVTARGGDIQYGWVIWEFPHILLSAEFHAVLVRDGAMFDITPKPDGEARILFLPDSVRRYERRLVLPVRRPLSPEGEALGRVVLESERLKLRYEKFPAVKGGTPWDMSAITETDHARLLDLAIETMNVRERCVAISGSKRRAAATT